MTRNHFAIDKDLFVYLCFIVLSYSTRNANIDSNVKLRTNYIENDTCFTLTYGDLNSRVGDLPDFVHNDNGFLLNRRFLPDDYKLDVPSQRTTQGHSTTSNGLLLVDFLRQTGMKIAKGRVLGDKHIGAYIHMWGLTGYKCSGLLHC